MPEQTKTTNEGDIKSIREGLLAFQEGSAAPEYEQSLLDALDRLANVIDHYVPKVKR